MTEKHLWWKVTGIIIMLYVITAGLLTPLNHGIVDVQPGRIIAGQTVTLNINSYNAAYLSAKDGIEVFLKHIPDDEVKEKADYLLRSTSINIIDDNNLQANFDLPAHIPDGRPVALFSVIVNDKISGAAVIPSKIIIAQDSINEPAGKRAWTLAFKPVFHHKESFHFPYRNILVETIRNTFFHVSLWFAMFLLFGMSVYQSIRYLKSGNPDADLRSFALVRTGLLFGILGCLTGSLWARYTWETWWTTDIKLNMAALTILIYISYLVLRAAIEDRDRKAHVAAAYNIFALVASIPMIFILPRLTDSLHPGSGGNPAFGSEDMDNNLRMVFYPSIIAFILIGLWMASLLYRHDRINEFVEEKENN